MRKLTLLILLLVSSGCGDGLDRFETAKVTGRVLCDGVPVPDVRIYFTPIAAAGKVNSGRQGMANAAADGTFVVSTYGTNDGAVVGRHNVMVDSPHPEDFPKFTCNCETDGNTPLLQVDVEPGKANEFTLSMLLKSKKSRPNIRADDLEDINTVIESEQEDARARFKE